MPKSKFQKAIIFLLSVFEFFIFCVPAQSQNSSSASTYFQEKEKLLPWDVRGIDSLYKLYLMQVTTDRSRRQDQFCVKGQVGSQNNSVITQKSTANFHGNYIFDKSSEQLSRPNSTVCYTQSGRSFLYQDSIMMWPGNPTLLRDGNVIVSGEFVNYNNPSYSGGGFCMKTDPSGNVLWARLYDSLNRKNYDFINYIKSIELNDGSIILGGRTDNSVSGNRDFILTRITSTGNIIWSKTYASRFWQGFNGSGDYMILNDLKEDTNTGDIYFVASHLYSFTVVTKVSPDGRVLWSNGYDYYDADFGFGLFIQADKLLLFQLGNGLGNQSNIYATGISKNNGDTLFSKSISQLGDRYAARMFNTYHATQLVNGHFLLSGPSTLYYEYPTFTGTKDLFHALIVELDEKLNFVRSYGFKNRIDGNFFNTKVSTFADGRGAFTMFKYIDGFTGIAQIDLFKNEQFYHQRKRPHNNEGLPFEPYMLLMPDGGFFNIKVMGDSTKVGADGARIDLYTIHTSDTASACLGTIDSTTTFWHADFEPVQWLLDSVRRNDFSESRPKTLSSFNFTTRLEPACKVISHCDSLSLQASSTNFCPGSTLTITVHNNKACGSLVPLSYDSSWAGKPTRLNDSTYTFQLNKPGQSSIKASLLGCILKEDSVLINVLPAKSAVNLGNDTILCISNTITLNAGSGFASYKWQDQSNDSTLTINSPGTYTVMVQNGCGGIFWDTIIVSPHPAIPFNAGPDRTKCNLDTLTLEAQIGFINYQWTNSNDQSLSTTQKITINPTTDVVYNIQAEKTPGCFVYDTIKVQVLLSPSIELGPDRSFCAGDSAVFNAGSTFASYSWSTGETARQVTAKAVGTYHIMAITNDGCKSADTVRVTQVYALPVARLEKNISLCFGESKIITPGNFARYSWNNGNITSSIIVSAIGKYWVNVYDNNGCTVSDTTVILAINPLPASFLPKDTSLCSYGSLKIEPLQTYKQYQWSTGAQSPDITINKPGNYYLTVTDVHNCTGIDTIAVALKQCIKGFYMPNAFTPNNDGKNDLLRPLLFGAVATYRFSLFNRWGQQVFQSNNMQQGWNGKLAGIDVQSDIFIWRCTYRFAGEKEVIEKGTVMLIR